MLSTRCFRFLQLALAGYVGLSVLYVSTKLFSPYLCAVVSCPAYLAAWPRWNVVDTRIGGTYMNTSSGRPSEISESTFISKAFSNSRNPNQIMPYYYRADGEHNKDDITITTLVTSNRFAVFRRLVERYQGPISATIHIKNDTVHVRDLLNSLHNLYTSSPSMARYVDVHLVLDPFDRQFNTWRNIARFFARTDYIMMLDIDFSLCTDFRKAMQSSSQIMEKLREGHSAFVIPAFEYVKHKDGLDEAKFPREKQTLLSLVKSRKMDMFHAFWPPGHNSTNYPRYYSASPGEVYKVTEYQHHYEPYVVFKKYGPPWCDERFVGYGGNKAACLYEMYLSGMNFFVLADHFIVHQSHKYPETLRKNERMSNRKIYNDFREEMCLRYLKTLYEEGNLNTTRGYNLLDVCTSIKGFGNIVTQFIGPS